MNCPTCQSPLEATARFCGVCGYQKPLDAPGDELPANRNINNRYTIESKIGEGGFGSVYRAVQNSTRRKVAIKLLHPEMARDSNLVARFRREGMVLCNLRDEHTITTYDFDQAPDGTLYIAMELLEGKSLSSVFEAEAPLAWKRVFKIIEEMCSSLNEAHGQGIVHRDLKPDNIYLEARPGNPEFVKILDFGIAKVRSGDAIQTPQLTATGDTLGTLEYMSPEQLRGQPLDGRSDIYALGVLAFEMMVGRLPFPNKDSPVALMMSQLKETPPAPSSIVAGIDPLADAVIAKCLEKDKTTRFDDVAQLAAAIRSAIENAGKAPAFVPPTPPPPGPAPVGTPEPEAPPPVEPKVEAPRPLIVADSRFDMPAQPPKKSNILVILIALIALGVVGAGVAIALR